MCVFNDFLIFNHKAKEQMKERKVRLNGLFRRVSEGACGLSVPGLKTILCRTTEFYNHIIHEVVQDVGLGLSRT